MEKLLMVQAMDVLEEVENRADVLLTDRYAIQRRRKNVTMFVNTSVSFFYYSSGFLALVWCAYRMLHGQMSFGSLTAVIQLVNQLQTPFVNLSGLLPPYVSMIASAERIMELENIQGKPEPSSVDPKALYAAMEYIGADNLSFSYDRDKVLPDATFSLTKGAFAVIAGPSGMGKKVHC